MIDDFTTYFLMWNYKIFIFTCAFVVLIDPLFCYIPIQDSKLTFVQDTKFGLHKLYKTLIPEDLLYSHIYSTRT